MFSKQLATYQASNQSPKHTLTQIWRKMQALTEIQDDSLLQQTPACIATQSIKQNQLEWIQTQQPNYKNNSKQIITDSLSSSELPSAKHFQQILTLKQTNQKLISDNKALFNQCIRLTKLFQTTKQQLQLFKTKPNTKNNHQLSQALSHILQLEAQHIKTKNQISILKKQNQMLKHHLAEKNNQLPNSNQNYWTQIVLELQKQKGVLLARIQDLEKNAQQNPSCRNCCSPTNSTHYDPNERDRIISNLKLVYQNQSRQLQNKIKQQNIQLQELKMFLKQNNKK